MAVPQEMRTFQKPVTGQDDFAATGWAKQSGVIADSNVHLAAPSTRNARTFASGACCKAALDLGKERIFRLMAVWHTETLQASIRPVFVATFRNGGANLHLWPGRVGLHRLAFERWNTGLTQAAMEFSMCQVTKHLSRARFGILRIRD